MYVGRRIVEISDLRDMSDWGRKTGLLLSWKLTIRLRGPLLPVKLRFHSFTIILNFA